MKLQSIVKKPIITEKSMTDVSGFNRYTFEVDMKASKKVISKAVEELLDVEVISVKTMIMPGKRKRVGRSPKFTKTSSWKKAVVQIRGDKKIDLFEKMT